MTRAEEGSVRGNMTRRDRSGEINFFPFSKTLPPPHLPKTILSDETLTRLTFWAEEP
jgi:hypothetical protein